MTLTSDLCGALAVRPHVKSARAPKDLGLKKPIQSKLQHSSYGFEMRVRAEKHDAHCDLCDAVGESGNATTAVP